MGPQINGLREAARGRAGVLGPRAAVGGAPPARLEATRVGVSVRAQVPEGPGRLAGAQSRRAVRPREWRQRPEGEVAPRHATHTPVAPDGCDAARVDTPDVSEEIPLVTALASSVHPSGITGPGASHGRRNHGHRVGVERALTG